MKLEGKNVLVLGAGKSGSAASELLLDKKIETVLYDGNKDLDVEKLYEKAPKLEGMPVLLGAVSYTHLDVYKRQGCGCHCRCHRETERLCRQGYHCLLYTSRCV